MCQSITIIKEMFEIIQEVAFQRAIVVGFFISISTAIVGNFVVASRQSMAPDMLSHTSLAGVGIGIFWQIPLHFSITLTATISSLILAFFWNKRKFPPEAVAVLLLSGGVAVAVFFAHLAKETEHLEEFLFGSILTITKGEMLAYLVVNFVIVLFMLGAWNRLTAIVFDSHFVKSLRQKNRFFEISLMFAVGLIVASGLKVIGGLLIGATLIIPVLSAQVFSYSFRQSVVWSILLNILGVLGGIIISFYWNIPTSSGIIFILIFEFVFLMLIKQVMNKIVFKA